MAKALQTMLEHTRYGHSIRLAFTRTSHELRRAYLIGAVREMPSHLTANQDFWGSCSAFGDLDPFQRGYTKAGQEYVLLTDLHKRSISAGLSRPLRPAVSAGLQCEAQHPLTQLFAFAESKALC